MIISRANPKGGRPLTDGTFPLHEDNRGNFGVLVGYLDDGEKILIPLSLADEFACQFAFSLEDFRKRMYGRPKINIRHKIIRILGGFVDSK